MQNRNVRLLRAPFACLLVAFAIATATSLAWSQSPAGSGGDAKGTADSIVVWLNQQKYNRASSVLNYPPSYSKQQLADDRAAVAGGLRLICNNLGNFAGSKPFTGVWLSYEVSMGGGTIEYWSSLSPMKTMEYTYAGKFEHFGKGLIVVRCAKIQSRWQPTMIVFQLNSSVPGSRSRAIDIMCELYRSQMKSQGQAVPPNLREQVSAQVPNYPPAKQ
jgi:hypothetical protein